MKNYLNKGHSLNMDNYYNSMKLSNALLKHKVHSTGVLRRNRKGKPKLIMNKKLKKGEHIWRRKVSDREVGLANKKTNHSKLSSILIMSGINRLDQMISYYSSPKKTYTFFKLYYYFLNVYSSTGPH